MHTIKQKYKKDKTIKSLNKKEVVQEKLKNNIQRKKYLFNIRKELIIIPAALGNDAGIIGSCQ